MKQQPEEPVTDSNLRKAGWYKVSSLDVYSNRKAQIMTIARQVKENEIYKSEAYEKIRRITYIMREQ